MSSPQDKLKDLKPTKGFFVGVDSDGCVFDSMEIKHKECFCPAFINHFGLQSASKYARETWDFVNLYSKTRGCNRFPAVTTALDLMADRKEVLARGLKLPKMQGLRDWIKRETKLGNPALEAEVQKTGNPDLKVALEWSKDVNAAVKKIVRDVPPFPFVRESLDKVTKLADIIVVSQTPTEALEREWHEHKIDSFARVIAGQELGSKTEHLALAAAGKYPVEKILMIGDAPGDLKAARNNKVLFFPINPGNEEACWQRFYEEAFDKFVAGTYAGAYEQKLVAEFESYLPAVPPWKK
jgi:phosphoglycolate phosphatase-like HAD superfamily hydrolase